MRLNHLILTGMLLGMLGSSVSFLGCTDLDGDNSSTDGDTDSDSDSDGDIDSDTDFDTSVLEDQTLGSSCTCIDDSCYNTGVPIPNAPHILGCADVADWTGTDKACLRSYAGDMASNTFFANGYCGLMATSCEGDQIICNSATIGDYDNHDDCPAGSVMVAFEKDVTALGSLNATIQNQVCTRGCAAASECRTGETDPDIDGTPLTQYDCIDKDGVKFCYDPRNIPETYTATAY